MVSVQTETLDDICRRSQISSRAPMSSLLRTIPGVVFIDDAEMECVFTSFHIDDLQRDLELIENHVNTHYNALRDARMKKMYDTLKAYAEPIIATSRRQTSIKGFSDKMFLFTTDIVVAMAMIEILIFCMDI